jgi:hypothetical protein
MHCLRQGIPIETEKKIEKKRRRVNTRNNEKRTVDERAKPAGGRGAIVDYSLDLLTIQSSA